MQAGGLTKNLALRMFKPNKTTTNMILILTGKNVQNIKQKVSIACTN